MLPFGIVLIVLGVLLFRHVDRKANLPDAVMPAMYDSALPYILAVSTIFSGILLAAAGIGQALFPGLGH